MIEAVTANDPRFKPIEIAPGFNLVLAEQTRPEPDQAGVEQGKSTNGSGKTFLLLICHFCLGSKSVASAEFVFPELAGWEFNITLGLEGRVYEVTRSVDDPSRVRVHGDLEGWEIDPRDIVDLGGRTASVAVEAWSKALGVKVYDLDPEESSSGRPTFGALLRYAIRRGINSYHDLFKSFVFQSSTVRDVSNAVLLGSDWKPFRDARRLLGEEKRVKEARSVHLKLGSAETRAPQEIKKLQGELEGVERRLGRLERRAGEFTVHPQYPQIEQRVSDLDAKIRERSVDNVGLRDALGSYRRAVEETGEAGVDQVRRIYAEARVEFPEQVQRQLGEAEEFARRLTENRREYLGQEIERLEEEISDVDGEIERLGKLRTDALGEIDGAGSAEQLADIRRSEADLIGLRGSLETRIEDLQGYQRELDRLDVELAKNKASAQAHLDAAQPSIRRVATLFEEFTERVFEVPGRLRIEVGKGGALRLEPRFGPKKSQGNSELLVFCYDLALAVAGAERGFGPRLLFHDSSVFDGVDPRQKAKAIGLAIEQSREHEIRYLLCINEGDVPWNYVDPKEVRGFVRGRITDEGDGGLLGMRFGGPADQA